MPRNIAITGNTFERCSRCLPDPFHAGSAASLASVIATAIIGPNRTEASEPFQRVRYKGVHNITLAHNRISGWYRGPAIDLGDAADVSVYNNSISAPPPASVAMEPAIKVSDAERVALDENELVGSWNSMSQAIQVEAGSTKQVTERGNRIRRELER